LKNAEKDSRLEIGPMRIFRITPIQRLIGIYHF
jgi:hypothetical protein